MGSRSEASKAETRKRVGHRLAVGPRPRNCLLPAAGVRPVARLRPWTTLLPFLVLLLLACQPPGPAAQVLTLSEGWEFSLGSSAPRPEVPEELLDTLRSWLPATVPGTVHTDLLANGLIPDPFWGDRELTLQWIGWEDWSYRNTFQIPSQFLEKEGVELTFHGLDTYAEVRLNGSLILEADNMFRSWTREVKRELRPGENTLEILFRSPLPPTLEARNALPYMLPAGNDRGDPPTRVFVRKAAYHFGWDWGPRFVTSGSWRPVEFVAWSGGRLTDLHVETEETSPDVATIRAETEFAISQDEADRRRAGGDLPVTLTLSSPEGAFEDASYQVPVVAGINTFEAEVQIPDPELWWPNGLGEPHLYTMEAVLNIGRRVDTLSTRFGLRELELVTEADSIGESFFFRVNGVPVFMKGANVIPLDHFSPRVTSEDYEGLFQDASEANMNMLRVWGGGIYEEDVFYDLADEHGILIWQDFMFANGMYPGDSLFLENIRQEATEQVRRLRTHPSVALWCGNNEMDEGWKNWGWGRNYDTPEDSAVVRTAYEAIFHDVLPQVVAKEDPARRYWPSSPSLGWGDPESLNRGDSHYWGVWHGQEPFAVFEEKLPRFSSEFGFQAFPPMETISAFIYPSQHTLQNPALLVHQKHPIGNELIVEYLGRDYFVPQAFDDFVYLSQLLQAEGMRRAFEAHRRARPRTMGTLYWQLNDTWPVVSWSSRDYFGRWKALHFAAKEAFAPILISSTSRGDTLEVWGVSDLVEDRTGELTLEILDFDGTSLWEETTHITLEANGSQLLWAGSISELLGESDPGQVVWSGTFTESDSSRTVHSDLYYFLPPKDLELGVPTIGLQVQREEDGVALTLTADVLAKNVYLALDGARFSHNFFDLLPGRPKTIRVTTDLRPEEVEAGLTIKTLAEVPREGLEVDATQEPAG